MVTIRSMVGDLQIFAGRGGEGCMASGAQADRHPGAGRPSTEPDCSGRLVGPHANSRDAGLVCTSGSPANPDESGHPLVRLCREYNALPLAELMAGSARATLMLIERRRSALTERCRKISDRYAGTGDPVCPTVRMPGAAVATGLEPTATYLEFLMAVSTSPTSSAVRRRPASLLSGTFGPARSRLRACHG
jgi:hypothetical protein